MQALNQMLRRSRRYLFVLRACHQLSDVTTRQIPIDFVLPNVATCEHDDLVRGHSFVHEGIRKSVQKRSPHSAILAHDGVHLRMEPEEGQRGVKFGDKHTTESGRLIFVPAARLANFCARLGAK